MLCIDLIFSTNQNKFSKYGVDVSIFDKCRHNNNYVKINIRVPLPPVYVHQVWDHNNASIKILKNSISF